MRKLCASRAMTPVSRSRLTSVAMAGQAEPNKYRPNWSTMYRHHPPSELSHPPSSRVEKADLKLPKALKVPPPIPSAIQ